MKPIKKEFAFMSLEDIKKKIDDYGKKRIKTVIIHNHTGIFFDAVITQNNIEQKIDIYLYKQSHKDPYHKFDDDAMHIYGIEDTLSISLSPDLQPDKKTINHMKRNNN